MDPLDEQTRDDTDEGWGERQATSGDDADLERLRADRPPHHDRAD